MYSNMVVSLGWPKQDLKVVQRSITLKRVKSIQILTLISEFEFTTVLF